MQIGRIKCRRFRGDGDVTAHVDWARGCRSRTKINLPKILMTASATSNSSSTLALLSEIQSLLFLAWPHSKIFDNFSFFTTTLILSTMKISFCFYDMFRSRNPSFPYYEYTCFDLNNMSEAECKAEFRFEKKDLPTLADAL